MTSLPLHDDLYQEMLASLKEVEREPDPIKQAVAGAQIVVHFLKLLKDRFIEMPEVPKDMEIQMFKEIKPRFASWFFHYRDRYKLHARRKPGTEPYRKSIKRLMRRMKKCCKRNCDLYTYLRVGHTHLDEQYFTRSNYDWKLNIDPNGALTDHSFYTYYDQQLARMFAYDLSEDYVLKLQGVKEATSQPVNKGKYTWTGAKAWLKEMIYGMRTAQVVNSGQANIDELARDLGEFFNVNLDDIYTFPRDMARHTRTPTPGLDTMRVSITNFLDSKEEIR